MADKNFLKKLQTEIDTAYLYKVVASLEKDEQIRTFYLEMAKIETTHARKVFEKAESLSVKLPIPPPSRRARILKNLSSIFGKNILLAVLMDAEKSISNAVVTKKSGEGKAVEGHEDRHVAILKSIGQLSGDRVRKLEGGHRNIGGNALRAAVLGANDGLVSNLSLVMGVAGATNGSSVVMIAGIAGLLAGAFSMALGEWISVRSSQELYERQIEIEMDEIENNPEEEKQEIILLYRAKGIPEEEAVKMADTAFSDKGSARSILISEELGLNPEELKNSPWEAAIASFILFVTGAIIPVAPFLFTGGTTAIIISIIASTLALFIIGSAITLITGKSFVRSGLRQVIIGLAAAAITFGVGKLIGVAITS